MSSIKITLPNGTVICVDNAQDGITLIRQLQTGQEAEPAPIAPTKAREDLPATPAPRPSSSLPKRLYTQHLSESDAELVLASDAPYFRKKTAWACFRASYALQVLADKGGPIRTTTLLRAAGSPGRTKPGAVKTPERGMASISALVRTAMLESSHVGPNHPAAWDDEVGLDKYLVNESKGQGGNHARWKAGPHIQIAIKALRQRAIDRLNDDGKE